jgi:TrmH family RNA methyltransferase
LQQKKYRIANKLFFAEGVKRMIQELYLLILLEHLYTTQHDFEEVVVLKKRLFKKVILRKNSALATQNTCLGVLRCSQEESNTTTGLILALDTIRDPGNLGTILRLCDWFGVKNSMF